MPVKNPERFSQVNLVKNSINEERLERKQKLAAALRIFGSLGLSEGITGHLTVRDPEFLDWFWINPLGLSFNQMKQSKLMLCDSEGQVVEGEQERLNRAAFAIHSMIYKARRDVTSVVHSHPLYATTWSILGRLLDPLTQSACAFYEDHALFDDYQSVVFDLSEGERIAAALEDKKALILKNHGLLTVGETVDAAAWWFISMERCCQMQLLAESSGHPLRLIDAEVARHARDNFVGHPYIGWYNFSPLWQDIIIQHPELKD